jgi:hypothetical protein
VLAYIHTPFFSSTVSAQDARLQTFFTDLYNANADVVLSADYHHYERFAPLAPSGRADARRGIRSFVVGTGGATRFPIVRSFAASRARTDRSFGVLVLRLLPHRYTWRFVPVPGSAFRDAGRGRCH